MGNLGGKPGGHNQKPPGKKEDKAPIKKPDPNLMKLGKKKRKRKGVEVASKLPNVTPASKCLLRMRKFERINWTSFSFEKRAEKSSQQKIQCFDFIKLSPLKATITLLMILEKNEPYSLNIFN